MEGNPLIQKEVTERNEQFQLLEELNGFKKLSSKQQQMVRLSLYVQQRAIRGTDAGSQENLGISAETGNAFVEFPRETDESDKPITNKYRISQQHIYDWYCFAATTGLEKEKVDKKVFHDTDVPNLLNKTGYEIKSENDISDFIDIALQEVEMPAVLQILGGRVPILHSAVLLGKDDSGTYILWEKKGVSIPYQLTTLTKIYADYASHEQEWLVRPFNLSTSEEIEE